VLTALPVLDNKDPIHCVGGVATGRKCGRQKVA